MIDLARNPEGLWDETALRQPPGSPGRLAGDWTASQSGTPSAAKATAEVAVGRVASVDALRGFAMFWIIAGDAFAWALHDMAQGKEGLTVAALQFVSDQFKHVPWDGIHFYDLLFPLFIFVIGISIVLSLSKLVERDGLRTAHRRVIIRSLILFALGVIYYGGASKLWPDIRLLGVLQRIALCYLVASLLFLHLDMRGLLIATASLLVGYWALMTFVPVPEVGAGLLEKDANLARWIDQQYLPGFKFYGDWDPEGLLSTLPAIATCLLGVFAGLLLKDRRLDPMQKTTWLVVSGAVLVVAGYLWGLQFPVIKSIWTSSFVLVAGGYSLLLLALFHLIVDVRKHTGWTTVFMWFGANAIALYMINNLAGFHTTALKLAGGDIERFIDASLTKGAGGLVIVVIGIGLATAVAGYLHHRKIFVRI